MKRRRAALGRAPEAAAGFFRNDDTAENSPPRASSQVARPPVSKPDRCQGCGAREGAPSVVFKRVKGKLTRVEGPPVKLVPVALADYGDRALCAACRAGAAKELRRLHDAGLAMVWPQ